MSSNSLDSKLSTPPAWATKLLAWLGDPDTGEEIHGDYIVYSELSGDKGSIAGLGKVAEDEVK